MYSDSAMALHGSAWLRCCLFVPPVLSSRNPDRRARWLSRPPPGNFRSWSNQGPKARHGNVPLKLGDPIVDLKSRKEISCWCSSTRRTAQLIVAHVHTSSPGIRSPSKFNLISCKDPTESPSESLFNAPKSRLLPMLFRTWGTATTPRPWQESTILGWHCSTPLLLPA